MVIGVGKLPHKSATEVLNCATGGLGNKRMNYNVGAYIIIGSDQFTH